MYQIRNENENFILKSISLLELNSPELAAFRERKQQSQKQERLVAHQTEQRRLQQEQETRDRQAATIQQPLRSGSTNNSHFSHSSVSLVGAGAVGGLESVVSYSEESIADEVASEQIILHL